MSGRVEAAKAELHSKLDRICEGADAEIAYHPSAEWWGSHPFNEIKGAEAITEIWSQLRQSMPDMERRVSLLVAGHSAPDPRPDRDPDGDLIVASMGHCQGTFRNDLLGIPATGGVAYLRCCEAHRVVDGKIAKSWILFDFLDLMRQAGVWPVARSLGAERMWPEPRGGGVSPEVVGVSEGRQSLEIVLRMHAALGKFDGRSLESMPHAQYWSDNFLWYGPAGIGTTRGLGGFRAHHQVPFLTGFPDRRGSGHYMRVGDGNLVATGGWPSVVATHSGEWLGLPATGRRVGMRVMDFYRIDGELIAENWIPIDIIHVLLQLGVDVFARMRHLTGSSGSGVLA